MKSHGNFVEIIEAILTLMEFLFKVKYTGNQIETIVAVVRLAIVLQRLVALGKVPAMEIRKP